MSNLQTSTIRVPKEILDSIKIYCKKNGKNVGDWVETAWNFIQKNDFDIYDQETTPFIPVQEQPRANGVEALCKLMAEFISTSQQQQLQLPDNREDIANREKDIAWLQNRLDESDKERQILQRRLNLALSELRHCKGMFATADERVLKELGL
jgi:hypothetical protein